LSALIGDLRPDLIAEDVQVVLVSELSDARHLLCSQEAPIRVMGRAQRDELNAWPLSELGEEVEINSPRAREGDAERDSPHRDSGALKQKVHRVKDDHLITGGEEGARDEEHRRGGAVGGEHLIGVSVYAAIA
jgi:hypothetical protein